MKDISIIRPDIAPEAIRFTPEEIQLIRFYRGMDGAYRRVMFKFFRDHQKKDLRPSLRLIKGGAE